MPMNASQRVFKREPLQLGEFKNFIKEISTRIGEILGSARESIIVGGEHS